MIIERGALPLLKLAVGGAALAATALLIRKLLKKPEVCGVVVRRAAVAPCGHRAANENVEVPWGEEL